MARIKKSAEAKLLEGANPEQVEVITHGDGPLLAAAVAGSGKTRAVVHRMAWLVEMSKVDPSQIIAVTFSKKAAEEMNVRLVKLLGETQARVGTFHSWAFEVLRIEQPAYKEWKVDDRDRYRICIKDAVGFRGMNWREADVTKLASYIGICKSSLARPGSARSMELAAVRFSSYQAALADEAFARAEQLRIEQRLLTFDDMLTEAHGLLVNGCRERWASKYRYVIQDETNDCNAAQNGLAVALAEGHRNYMVVGDPQQTIYSFRGSDVRYLLSFERDWPGAKVVHMARNYRCSKAVVAVANQVGVPAKQKLPMQMVAESEDIGSVTYNCVGTMDDEADLLALQLKEEKAGGKSWKDCVVLYRTNAQSRAPEEQLLAARIPYEVIGGTNFYDRREVRDLLSYLRLSEGRGNADDIRRAINSPWRYLGRAFVERLMELRGAPGTWADRVRQTAVLERIQRRQEESAFAWADMMEALSADCSRGLAPASMLDGIVQRTGYLDWLRKEEGEESPENSRVSNVKELVRAAGRFQTVAQLLDYVEQVTAASKKAKSGADSGEQPDRVLLMSIHRSKGLEWPVVFLIGCNEGILPHGRCEDEEEERRLFYVAVTRAKEVVHLSSVRTAAVGTRVASIAPSHYVTECIEAGLIIDPAAREEGQGDVA